MHIAQLNHSSFSLLFIVICLGEASDEDDNDQDTLKETLLETNPYLLGLTIVVSILHSVFEFLAFKNGKCLHKNFFTRFDICIQAKILQS